MLVKTDLCDIALRCGTDKVNHGYTPLYDKHFSNMREKKINLLEIGVHKGASLQAWSNYFLNATIYGIDDCSGGHTDQPFLNPTNEQDIAMLRLRGFNVFNASQSNRAELKEAFSDTQFDIVIDDGSHFQNDQQISFGALFSTVAQGGLYVIEDVLAFTKDAFAYRKDWGPQKNWGLEDSENLTDATLIIFEQFEKTGTIVSPHLTAKEIEYANENIKSVTIYYPGLQSCRGDMFSKKEDRAVLSGASALIFIEKN